jgi:transmembrane sensor
MTENHLVFLIARRVSGHDDPEGDRELEAWAEKDVANRKLLEECVSEEELEKQVAVYRAIDPAEGYRRWISYLQSRRKKSYLQNATWLAAASLLVAVVIAGLFKPSHPVPSTGRNAVAKKLPVLPGRNTAMLTLSDGRQVLLDSANNGELTQQGNVRLVKEGNGILSYAIAGKGIKEVAYNKLITPRAGQYQLLLPDGSHVWLNNASSIRYPVAFLGKDRAVELIGEAYFEIAKDATRPFIVKLKDESVEVLGTGFNIKAYADEPLIQTTLLEGSVRVTRGDATVLLQPNEQAQANEGIGLKVIKGVPAEDIVSWKNGFFYFGRASLKEVMQQLGRWYDVDVRYEGTIPANEFGGKIDRNLPLNDLLQYLDKNQVHFRLEGRTIVVLPI